MLLALLPTAALAAAGGKGPSEAVFVADVLALVLAGRLLGEVMQRLGQPAVVGQLLAGILLGPSVFGALAPHWHGLLFPGDPAQKAMVDGLAQMGVLLLLLLTGMDTDMALVRRVGSASVTVSICGIAVPFALGFGLGAWLLPASLVPEHADRLVTALFLGTALSISSVKIVAMVVREMNFMRRDLGQVIVASAIIDDTIGWIIIAVTFGLARPGGLDATHLVISIGGTLGFLAFAYTIGRRLVWRAIRWANDTLASDYAVVTTIIVIMGLFALVTDFIGVHTVLGAFVAGVLVGESPILTRRIEGQLRGLVVGLFMPVFFGLAGLGTDLSILADPTLLGATLVLIAIASLGKFGGAFLGGTLGGLGRRECLALALGMNARGSTEVIVASIGLAMGALDNHLFTMIVTMAVATTMAMPPTLRWALARLPPSPAEKERLDREAYEATDFVANLERLLVTTDSSPSGVLAGRLAGILGGARALPVTVVPFGAPAGSRAEDGAELVTATAEQARPAETAPAADVTLRTLPETQPQPAELAEEASKGYDLTLLGLEDGGATGPGLPPAVVEAFGAVGGARAVVVARGIHRLRPHGWLGSTFSDPAGRPDPRDDLRILVPVTGSDVSRRAAALAFALARPGGVPVTVLYVSPPPTPGTAGRSAGQRGLERAILQDIEDKARRSDLDVRLRVRIAADPADAILRQARRSQNTLIVLGVSPRPSEAMMFGRVAADILERARASLLFVASAPAAESEEAA